MSQETPSTGYEANKESIGVTAFVSAYARTMANIPYAKEIFEEMQKMQKERTGESIPTEEIESLVENPEVFEARYKVINQVLEKNHTKTVLEIACGYSGRGAQMTKDPSIEYIEFDQPQVIERKKKIFSSLSDMGDRENLHLQEGNALDLADLEKATEAVGKDKEVTVVSEGVMRYLSPEEQEKFSKNIHTLLEKHGGFWVTPDVEVDLSTSISKEKSEQNVREVEAVSGVDITKNTLGGEKERQKFFENLGFTVERVPFLMVRDQISIGHKRRLQYDYLSNSIGRRVAFVLRVKK